MRSLWVALGLIALSVAGVAAVAVSPWADVDKVTIFGLHRVSLAEATEAVGFGPGRLMVAVNTGAAEAALLDIAWIAAADVERRWPGTVRVTVTEREPVAVALSAPGRWMLVDDGARVLTGPVNDATVERIGLPRISGIRAAPDPGGFLDDDAIAPLAALAGLTEGVPGVAQAPLAPTQIRSIWRDQQDGLLVDTTIGVRLVLGDDTQLRSKIVAVTAVLDHRRATGSGEADVSELASGPTTLLDVSVPHLPVERALR